MKKFSVSFTLGKASVQHNANVEHNNREFIAKNVNTDRISQNVIYKKQNIREAYDELFSDALKEYNDKQKQPCRRIKDYYEHISNSGREEAFYEAIVQFGDIKTAPCGSESGEQCKKMLDEYIKGFQERNPNLHIFNAVLHMDEASPHLHIDFIPFYTEERKNSLSKGVSMRAALIEQGFNPQGGRYNQLVAWEESERAEMEKILQRHNFSRDDKECEHDHMTVDEYKAYKDRKINPLIAETIKNLNSVTEDELAVENVISIKTQLHSAKHEIKTLKERQKSPYKSFYYSAPDKQAFVQAQLDKMGIPYRETDNGFEAQECYAMNIRKIEKEYKPVKNTERNILKEIIDKLVMRSQNLDELLKRLEEEGYTVKKGKYISVKPKDSGSYIRLKSLGVEYSEYAIKNRILDRKKFEADVNNKLKSTPKDNSIKFIMARTLQFYTVTFAKGVLPMHKKRADKPFSYRNDAELDKLLAINTKINNGATFDSLKHDFESAELLLAEKEKALDEVKDNIRVFTELKEKVQIVYEGKASNRFTREQAVKDLQRYPKLGQNNYQNVYALLRDETHELEKVEVEIAEARKNLEAAANDFSAIEKICGGTYVQSLVGEERLRREADNKPNGLKHA